MSWQLIVYCVLIALGSLAGGWIPTRWKLGHRQTQMVISFVSGVMLGVALLHLLPHGANLLGDVEAASVAALCGLLFMFMMIRLFHFHYHDESEQVDAAHAVACSQHEHDIKRADISWAGIAFGFSVHTLIDGIALAAAVGQGTDESGWAGLAVFLAIVFHKPLDALTIASAMSSRRWSRSKQMTVNVLFSLMCPLGALLFVLGISGLPLDQSYAQGWAIAFSAGVFLCISLTDLLPEVQFHSHDRLQLSGMLLLGVAMAWIVNLLSSFGFVLRSLV